MPKFVAPAVPCSNDFQFVARTLLEQVPDVVAFPQGAAQHMRVLNCFVLHIAMAGKMLVLSEVGICNAGPPSTLNACAIV